MLYNKVCVPLSSLFHNLCNLIATKLCKVVCLAVLSFCTYCNHSFGHDTMLEFESSAVSGSCFSYLSNLDNCFTSGKATYPWEYAAFNNTCLPTILGKNNNECNNTSTGTWALLSTIGRGAVYIGMLTQFPIGSIIALLALGAEYVIMVDLCTNAYIVAPHEQINLELGLMDCQTQNGQVVNVAKGALTATDVPFYYHCDPNYDTVSGQKLQPGNNDDAKLIGRTWGYMGAASPYCVGDAANYARGKMVGKVVVHYISGWSRFWSGLGDRCQKGGSGSPTRNQVILDTKEDQYLFPAHYHAYYRFNDEIGKLQMCVVAPWTLLPIRVGCSYVPPPNDANEIDEFIQEYLRDTRCYYFLTGRQDLNSLGKVLAKFDDNGYSGTPVKGFLSSDLHVVSTVVGCIQDLLIKIFINPQSSVIAGGKPFFQMVQDNMRQVVFAALVLYVSLLGIKLMTLPQVPQRSEIIMYVVKFGLVLYFSLGSVWYKPVTSENTATGLYPALLNSATQIAQFFMSAQNNNDPIGLCRYRIDGGELLSERKINVAALGDAVKPTIGKGSVVQMTLWDLVDCKVVNYLNFGSCKYTISGMVGVWIIAAAFFVGLKGFLLSIVSFLYCFMLLMIIFKFVHIFILSMFTITILVSLSPVFVAFALFEFTSSMFQKWMSMLLGYVIYPGLFFAFIALMLMTFDSVFFGDLDIKGGTVTVKEACRKVTSLYCSTYSAVDSDPCAANAGTIGGKLTKRLDLGPLGKFTILNDIFLDMYLEATLKLMLFAFLFYMFMGSISEFLAMLTGVQDLGSLAKGSINIAKLAKEIGTAVATKGMSLAQKAASSAKDAASDAGKPPEGDGSRGGGGGSGKSAPRGNIGGSKDTTEIASKIGGAGGAGGAS